MLWIQSAFYVLNYDRKLLSLITLEYIKSHQVNMHQTMDRRVRIALMGYPMFTRVAYRTC